MGHHTDHDSSASSRRRIQLWYTFSPPKTYIAKSLILSPVVDLSVYPTNIFNLLLVTGLLIIRRRRRTLNLPRPEYKTWTIAIGFAILSNVYLLVAPWYPPSGGANGGDVSFWYGTYLCVGIGL